MTRRTSEARKGRFRLDLHGAYLRRTDLSHAILERANLAAADFSNADMRDADFKDAILEGTVLKGADLTGAKNLTKEQLRGAILDQTTRLPAEFSVSEFLPELAELSS
jgi:uncharacterized protein YjbI with pentapeptide repeats